MPAVGLPRDPRTGPVQPGRHGTGALPEYAAWYERQITDLHDALAMLGLHDRHVLRRGGSREPGKDGRSGPIQLASPSSPH
jgi:hypothetical protein